MSKNESPIAALRNVVHAMNCGDRTEALTQMTSDVVIIDDLPPFHRKGRRDAERWLESLVRTRTALNASLKLESADVSEVDEGAYIVMPAAWTGRVQQVDSEISGILTATLIRRETTWLIQALVWASREKSESRDLSSSNSSEEDPAAVFG